MARLSQSTAVNIKGPTRALGGSDGVADAF